MPHDTTSDTVASHTTAASKKATSCLITTVAQSHSLLSLYSTPRGSFHCLLRITYADLIVDVQVRRHTIPLRSEGEFWDCSMLCGLLKALRIRIILSLSFFLLGSFLGLVLILNGNLCLWTGLNGIQSPVLKGIDNWMIWKSLFLPPLEYP
ncbi:hypothetical protein POTOM_005359 [Populus tomentosa]|uniref:Uncharacterized protein n=1 Tax=Populus tomentosa TaxID=118781 RepID=A0A8X8AGW6_POPTO|nr:hypothetical protein POTOM_005359 [Populus tomentosa]